MSNIFSRWFERRVNEAVTKRVQLILTDRDGFYEQGGPREERDRAIYDREEVLRQCLEAWRVNPLARRVVALTTQFALGGGVSLNSSHPATQAFLQTWWNHRLNQMPLRLVEWSDELTRAGELFILVSTGADGMSYLRAIPALAIAGIRSAPNDSAQETAYIEKDSLAGELGELREGRVWPAYDPADRCARRGRRLPAGHAAFRRQPAGRCAAWRERPGTGPEMAGALHPVAGGPCPPEPLPPDLPVPGQGALHLRGRTQRAPGSPERQPATARFHPGHR